MPNVLTRTAVSLLQTCGRITPGDRGGYRLARLARRLVPRAQWQDTFHVAGIGRLALDLATYPDVAMACGLYEVQTLRRLGKLLRPGMWFVDAGANLGYFTLAAARLVGPDGRVDAYEPDPLNRARLDQNLRTNMIKANVHGAALGAQAGAAQFYHPTQPDLNHGQASLWPVGAASQAHGVRVVRLDEDLGPRVPDVIKIDVEGAELAALQGMMTFLQSEHPPHLIIEHNPATAATAGHAAGDLFTLLQRLQPRYTLFAIGGRLRRIRSAAQLAAWGRQVNLLAVVGENASRVSASPP